MDRKNTVNVLSLLKDNFEKGWEIQGKCPREQKEEHRKINPKGEEYWRQLYIEALTTAIDELK